MLRFLRVASNASSSPASLHISRLASQTRMREGESLPTRHRFSSAARRARASPRLEGEEDRRDWAWEILEVVSEERSTFSSSWPPSARSDAPWDMVGIVRGWLLFLVLLFVDC